MATAVFGTSIKLTYVCEAGKLGSQSKPGSSAWQPILSCMQQEQDVVSLVGSDSDPDPESGTQAGVEVHCTSFKGFFVCKLSVWHCAIAPACLNSRCFDKELGTNLTVIILYIDIEKELLLLDSKFFNNHKRSHFV